MPVLPKRMLCVLGSRSGMDDLCPMKITYPGYCQYPLYQLKMRLLGVDFRAIIPSSISKSRIDIMTMNLMHLFLSSRVVSSSLSNPPIHPLEESVLYIWPYLRAGSPLENAGSMHTKKSNIFYEPDCVLIIMSSSYTMSRKDEGNDSIFSGMSRVESPAGSLNAMIVVFAQNRRSDSDSSRSLRKASSIKDDWGRKRSQYNHPSPAAIAALSFSPE